jgi:parallel beta-helix repeat protein
MFKISKVSRPGAVMTRKWASSLAPMLASSVVLAVLSGPINAASFCVNAAAPASSGCLATIGAAVAAASPNDTINVAAGTYKESVTIGKPLSLIGADATKVFINATGLGVGIYVDGIDNASLSNVLISGFTVENANFEGILVANASAVTIASNIVMKNNNSVVVAAAGNTCPNIPAFETSEGQDCGEGIHLLGATHTIVVNNTVQNNSGGILVSDDTGATHDNTIAGNTVMNNLLACGITLASHTPAALTKASAALGVYNNVLVGNTVSGNGLNGVGGGAGIFASVPGAASYNNVVINNVLTGNGLPGVVMHSHTPGQTLTNNVAVGNTISGNGADNEDATTPGTAGVNVFGVSSIAGTIIALNTISGEAYDVVINGPGAVDVQRNTFTGGVGVANLSTGSVNADGNWWGCASNPTYGVSGFAGCATTSGAVSVSVWAPVPIVK